MKYSCIIWDWNGTLLDDTGICMDCVNDMLRSREMELIDLERYRSYVDIPIIRFYEHIFDLKKVPFDTIVREFTQSYIRYENRVKLMQGAVSALDSVCRAGIPQIILSAANTAEINRLLSRFGLEKYFIAVLGASDFRAESKTERAEAFFGSNDNGRKLVIGDTTHDWETAEALKGECILFSGGHQNRKALEKTGAPIIDSLDELSDIIDLF